MVTKTNAELVVQIMLATLAPFFGNVREDLRAMFAFHESEIARQASESLHLVQRALVAMTTFFTRKMDEHLQNVKASFPDCASIEYSAALVGKTVDLHAEIKSMVDAFMSNMSAAAMSPAKKTTITIDALPDVKLTFSPTELAEWLDEVGTPSPVPFAGTNAGPSSAVRIVDEDNDSNAASPVPFAGMNVADAVEGAADDDKGAADEDKGAADDDKKASVARPPESPGDYESKRQRTS